MKTFIEFITEKQDNTTPTTSLPGGNMSSAEVKAHSKKLVDHQKINKESDWKNKTKEHLRYYENDVDAMDRHPEGEGSSSINGALARAHKTKTDPTKHMEDFDAKVHKTIMSKSRSLGHETHLYSGTSFDLSKEAKKSNGVVHLPTHLSTSHSVNIASVYASGDGNHMIHIHAKPTDKGVHIPGSAEHETVIPAGTKLKYSHSSKHTDGDKKINVHHFTIHHQD